MHAYLKLSAFLLITALSLASATAGYQVRDFVNSRDGLIGDGFGYAPVINNNGMIAFAAATSLYDGQVGLVYGNLNAPGTLHRLNNVYNGSMVTYAFAINDANDLLWVQEHDGLRMLATANPATPDAPTFYNATASSSLSGRSIGMNQTGFFTFRDTLGGSVISIFDSNTSALRTLTVSGESRWEGPSVINDQGQMLYGTDNAGGGLFLYDWNSGSTTALTPSNVTIPEDQSLPTVQPTLNGNGLAAFFAKEGEQTGLYTLDINSPNGEAFLIATIEEYVINPLSINDSGQLLFVELKMGDQGWEDSLQLWDGNALHTLLETGDSFAGGTISELFISGYALNEKGEVVFGYLLEDGTRGIGYASIPESSAVLLIALGGVMLGVLHRRRSLA